jgi:arylsulfatase A-like enzyme
MQWPAGIQQPGRVVPGVFSSLDLFPTFCELAKAESSETIDGQSILPCLNSDRSPADRELVWRTGTHAELDRGNWVALRSGDWKYVQDDDGREFLFNLKTDPHEQTNLQRTEPQRFNQLREKAATRIAELTP